MERRDTRAHRTATRPRDYWKPKSVGTVSVRWWSSRRRATSRSLAAATAVAERMRTPQKQTAGVEQGRPFPLVGSFSE